MFLLFLKRTKEVWSQVDLGQSYHLSDAWSPHLSGTDGITNIYRALGGKGSGVSSSWPVASTQ